ncbi:MAG: hypothetical protein MJY98_01530 [Fibrobacter sp.]|nr:hypothetical protein [Fibrobacter sp.]
MMSSKFLSPIAIQFAFIAALICSACSTDVAGTDEQTNSVAGKDDNISSGIPAENPTDSLLNIQSSSSFEEPFSSSSIDGGSTGTILRPGISGAGDSLEFEQFDTPLIPVSIFTLDTLVKAPAFDQCLEEYCNLDSREKITFTKGTFYYQIDIWAAKVECESNNAQVAFYSVFNHDIVKKKFFSHDEGEVEMFKQDCLAEGGSISDDFSTCSISNISEFYYYDSNWSKYSQIILSHCNNI